MKIFFSANNVYFVKNTFFFQKNFFFNLVLQQMNNHSKQPTSNSFKTLKTVAIYSLKLYNKSIIILLKKVLANICSQISKIRLIL